jgi:hypothetical protein
MLKFALMKVEKSGAWNDSILSIAFKQVHLLRMKSPILPKLIAHLHPIMPILNRLLSLCCRSIDGSELEQRNRQTIPNCSQSPTAHIERYARKLGKQITSVQKRTMKTLQDYPWPGNIRELESVLERAAILCIGPVLQVADKLKISSPPVLSTIRTLEEVERNQILKILSETRWRIEGKNGAAAILGLHPSTLRARMHKLGILRPEAKESD